MHPLIAALYLQKELSSQSSSHASDIATLFTLRLSKPFTFATEAF